MFTLRDTLYGVSKHIQEMLLNILTNCDLFQTCFYLQLRSEFDSIAFFIHHFHGNAKEETNSLPERFLINESPSAILYNGGCFWLLHYLSIKYFSLYIEAAGWFSLITETNRGYK